MRTLGTNIDLHVLVVDDNENFVETMVADFQHHSVIAEGISDPAELFRRIRNGGCAKFDMIFLDMRLGFDNGRPITAQNALLHLMTYEPRAHALVFTQEGITVDECVRCVQLGSLGIVPKSSSIDDFILAAQFYPHIGDIRRSRESMIGNLWDKLMDDNDPMKGRYLEMLSINLFNSIPGFHVITTNRLISAGEIDVVVENGGDHQFWRELRSFHLVIECKNTGAAAQRNVFNILSEKVRARDLCNTGILISWKGISSGFRQLQTAGRSDVPRIFALDREHLQEMVRRPAQREEYLRHTFGTQL
jgi:ActR/RegA family two-component response regulator